MDSYTYFKFNSTHYTSEEIRSFLPQKISILPRVKAKHLPKVIDGKLIISQANGELLCLEINTKEVLWRFIPPKKQQADWISGFEIIIDHQDNIILALENELVKINKNTGNLLNSNNLPEQTIANFKIDHFSENKLYTTTSLLKEGLFKFYLCSYDIDQNKTQWQIDLKEDVPILSVLVDNTLIVFFSSNKVIAYDTDKSNKYWVINNLGTYIDDIEGNKQDRIVDGIPFIIDNRLIFGITDKLYRAYDINTGKQLWETSIEEKASGSYTTDTTGNIHVIGARNYYCINSNTGNIISKKNVQPYLEDKGFNFFTIPTITDQYIFFSERYKGTVFALDIDSGKIVWEFTCKSQIPKNHFPLLINEEMYIVDDQGHLYVFSKD